MPDSAAAAQGRSLHHGDPQHAVRGSTVTEPRDAGMPHGSRFVGLRVLRHVLDPPPSPRSPALPGSHRARSARRPVRRYELVRGFGSENWAPHGRTRPTSSRSSGGSGSSSSRTSRISRALLSRSACAARAPLRRASLPRTAGVLIWVHSRRRHAFAFLRTTLIVSTGLALPGTSSTPPRRRGSPTSASPTPSAPTRDQPQLRPARQPLQPDRGRPEPPLRLRPDGRGRRRVARVAGRPPDRRRYPALMLLIIVATGNHFLFDAAAGALVVAAGWLVAARLREPSRPQVRLVASAETWSGQSAPQRAQAA